MYLTYILQTNIVGLTDAIHNVYLSAFTLYDVDSNKNDCFLSVLLGIQERQRFWVFLFLCFCFYSMFSVCFMF
jgi:hypothetical protein